MDILKELLKEIRESNELAQAERGCEFLSGTGTLTGSYGGLSIGSTKPTTLNLTIAGDYRINGQGVTSGTNLADYFESGLYYPISYTTIYIDSGYVIAWRK
jgi:hypothetical protein